MQRWAVPLSLLLITACGDDKRSDRGDTSSTASTQSFATEVDADADADADTDADADADTDTDTDTNTGLPLDGFGDLTGDCGVLTLATTGGAFPALFRLDLDFGLEPWDPDELSEGGRTILDEGNLGGSSVESEAIAYDVLYRCERALLLKTESEILYDDPAGKKTDLLVSIDDVKVGVSVTRAYHHPPEEGMDPIEATGLLTDKLSDIRISTANAADADEWDVSILAVIAWDADHAVAIEAAWETLDASIRDRTTVFLTATHGEADAILY